MCGYIYICKFTDRPMRKYIPSILLYSRIPAALAMILLAWLQPTGYAGIIIGILIYGVVSDFLDGFTARMWSISTEHMRKADSNVDQLFWLCAAAATYIIAPQFYHQYIWLIAALLILEGLAYLISYLRFRNIVATHAILSKLWVVTLLLTFIQVVYTGSSSTVFLTCFWVGLISRLEIVCIMLLLRNWVNDVPSVYHAIQLRKGKEIKRNKVFNG